MSAKDNSYIHKDPMYEMIRLDVLESLDRYSKHHIRTGDFLKAVLSNDLFDACGRADEDNKKTLFNIVQYIYNELPGDCYGSPEKYKEWIE